MVNFLNNDRKPNPVDVHVGERLRARRAITGLSQDRLAEAVGITFQQVQKYERGTNRISASRLWQFSRILKVPVSYFFENFSEKEREEDSLYAMADNEQAALIPEGDVMDRKETINLLREYYAIPDPKLRRDILKMIRTMAGTLRGDTEE